MKKNAVHQVLVRNLITVFVMVTILFIGDNSWAKDRAPFVQLGNSFAWNDNQDTIFIAEKDAFQCESCGKLVNGQVDKCPHCKAEFASEKDSKETKEVEDNTASDSKAAPASDSNFIKKGQSGFFIGIGGVLAIEQFDFENEDQLISQFDNTGGLVLFAGFRFNNVFSLHLRFDYYPEFESSVSQTINNATTDVDSTTAIYNLQLALKIAPEFGFLKSLPLRPFVIGGFGIMFTDAEAEATNSSGFVAKASENSEDAFIEVGFGIDFDLKFMLIGASYSWVFGLDDVKDFDFQKLAFHAQFNF